MLKVFSSQKRTTFVSLLVPKHVIFRVGRLSFCLSACLPVHLSFSKSFRNSRLLSSAYAALHGVASEVSTSDRICLKASRLLTESVSAKGHRNGTSGQQATALLAPQSPNIARRFPPRKRHTEPCLIPMRALSRASPRKQPVGKPTFKPSSLRDHPLLPARTSTVVGICSE